MRYLANIAIAFSANERGQDLYALWEFMLVVDSERPKHAIGLALLNSRKIFDVDANWRALGYSAKPCFYAVRSLDTEEDIPGSMTNWNADHMALRMIGTLDKEKMTKIIAHEEVLIPYRVIPLELGNAS